MRCVLCLLAILPMALGQRFSFGIVAGGTATGRLDPSAQETWEGKEYAFGPTVEYRLSSHLSGEVDVLYKRTGTRNDSCVFGSCSFARVRAGVFEFPMLVKYRIGSGPVRPFASGGISLEWVRHAVGKSAGFITNPVRLDAPVQFFTGTFGRAAETHVGGVGGGGLELRTGPVALAPEVRYTRWSGRYWEFNGSRGFFTGSSLNQVEGLFSVRF